jgi:PKD repeat protein
MKEIKYLIAILIIGFIFYEPANNSLNESKRFKNEKRISELNSYQKLYFSSKSKAKEQRPDLRGMREYLMTADLSNNLVPKERLIKAINTTKNKRKSLDYKRKMTEVNWLERGPNNIGGRTRAVMIDPNNQKKLWAAGVTGGLWYNNDITSTTQNWNLVDGTWASLSVTSIASDPINSNVMYVGTGERFGNAVKDGSSWYNPGTSKGIGLFKSSDSGSSWSYLTSTSDFAFITDILIRNENGQSAIYITAAGNEFEGTYVGREKTGIWKSVDGANSWTRVTSSIQESTGYTEFNNLQLGANNRIWAGTKMNSYWQGGGEIFFSDDGENWTESIWRSEIGVSGNRVDVRVAPSDPNTIYALIAQIDTPRWIARSTDNGATWTQLDLPQNQDSSSQSFGGYLSDTNGTANWAMGFGVDASDANTIYAGVIDAYKSTDGGDSWAHISDWRGANGGLEYLHADHHAVRSVNNNEIIFANDGGIFYTSDGGENINQRNEGYNVGQFYSVALHPTNGSEYVLGGTQDNGSWKIEGSGVQNGNQVSGGDGGFALIDSINPNYQFTAANFINIYRSTDGGISWSTYATHDGGQLINPMTIDPKTQTLYVNVDDTSILRLDNYATLASKYIMNINLGSQVSFFKMSPYTDDLLFIGTQAGRIFKVSDASTSNFVVQEIGGSNIQGYISSIDVGSNDNQILVTVSNYGAQSIFETFNGGGVNGWTNVEGDLPDMPVRAGLYNRDNFNQVIVGTDIGTWTSDDISVDSPTWNPSNDGIDNVRVDMLATREDGAIAAATHGRGIYYSADGFTSTAPLNASFSPNKTSGVYPLSVTFNDRSTGNVTSWNWEFGDGTQSTEQSPTHTFNNPGKYNISLQVSDGNTSDIELKSELIWATAAQDTLWEEGVETTLWSFADGRRDIHNFYIYDANSDNNEFGQWYYYQEGNTYDGRYMVGINGAGSDADDWIVTPELWLRPGVANIFKYYHQTDTTDGETYEILLSPSGGRLIEDFTENLREINTNDSEWTLQSFDLSNWAGSKVRIAFRNKDSNSSYLFFDGFHLTADQLDIVGSPLAPAGVYAEAKKVYDASTETWNPSNTEIGIYWNRNGETDLSSYNVYASQTENFTADSNSLLGQGNLGDINSVHFSPARTLTSSTGTVYEWADKTFYFIQTFGIDSLLHTGLQQGDKWYYKVGSVDNDGNETVGSEVSFLLDSSGPTAGTVTLNDIYDSSYLRSTSEVSITVDGWSDNTGISAYFMGIGSSGDDNSADIVAYKNVGLTNLQLTDLTLDDFTTYYLKVVALDGADNQSSFVIKEFNTYTSLLGDSDSDWDVDVTDLNAFVSAWPNVDIGPASGASPYPMPSLDGTADINDISVFSRNWLWTKAQGRIAQESQEIIPIEFDAEVVGNQIIIELPEGTTAGRFELSNLNNIYTFKASNKEGYMVLENTDQENQYYEFEFGNLSSNDNQLIITVEGAAIKNDIEFSYQLFSKDGLAGNGMIQLSNPDEFKLYQNYPNPFNNQTTIKYDIPAMMVNVVDVEIYIYNTLGKLVKIIDEGDKSVGQYTTVWDGKNDDGDKVSSGMYFYQLRAKVDGQSDYNKTMKMVIVR